MFYILRQFTTMLTFAKDKEFGGVLLNKIAFKLNIQAPLLRVDSRACRNALDFVGEVALKSSEIMTQEATLHGCRNL